MIFKLGKLDKEVAERISNGETPVGIDFGYSINGYYWYQGVLTFKFEGEDTEHKVDIEIDDKDQPILEYLYPERVMHSIDWKTGIITY